MNTLRVSIGAAFVAALSFGQSTRPPGTVVAYEFATTPTVCAVAGEKPSGIDKRGNAIGCSAPGTAGAVAARLFQGGPASGSAAAPTYRAILPSDLGTGSPGVATLLFGDGTWRALAAGDVPSLDFAKITTGLVPLTRLATCPEGQIPKIVSGAWACAADGGGGGGGTGTATAIQRSTVLGLPATCAAGDVWDVYTNLADPATRVGLYTCSATNQPVPMYGVATDATLTTSTSPTGTIRFGVTPGLFARNSDNGSGFTDPAAFRANLGFGNSSTRDVGTIAGTVAAGDHTHPGGASNAPYCQALSAVTTTTITAATHGFGTRDLLVQFFDASWNSVTADYAVAANFNVTANFNPAFTGRVCIAAIGGVGPQGPAGAAGAAGADGASFTWRGAWSGATAYVIRDVVERNGSAYIAIAGSTGSDPASTPASWSLMAAKGADGAGGAAYRASASYTGTPITITAATHGKGSNPVVTLSTAYGPVEAMYRCSTSGGALVGCGDASSNGNVTIYPFAQQTYQVVIQ